MDTAAVDGGAPATAVAAHVEERHGAAAAAGEQRGAAARQQAQRVSGAGDGRLYAGGASCS